MAPDVTETIDPITEPKQWYRGTGAQMRSFSVAFSPLPMAMPLFSRLRWLSMAPLGEPVVPEVYWMLATSSGVAASSGKSVPPAIMACHDASPSQTMCSRGRLSPLRDSARISR